jgi:DNA-binding transcriptional ArsR family regulator
VDLEDPRLGKLRAAAAALGEPRRFQLLLHLIESPRTVLELTRLTGWPQSLVSHHLATLARAGLTEVHRIGRFRRYQISSGAGDPTVEALLRILRETAGGGWTGAGTPADPSPMPASPAPETETEDRPPRPAASADLEDYLL